MSKDIQIAYLEALDKISDLEAKLADLEDDHNKLIEQYNKQYNDLCKEINVHSSARERFVKKVKELEQQLAEKEKEIEQTKKSYARMELNELLGETCQRGVSDWTAWVYCIKRRIKDIETRDYNQDKISFCIEQLEKVKDIISWKPPLQSYEEIIKTFHFRIDNQIKQLKEMK